MAAPTVQTTATTASVGGVTSLAVNMPASVASGDLLVMSVFTVLDVSITTPAGWTASVAVGDGFGSCRVATFYKLSDGTEGATVTVTVGSSEVTAEAARITGFNAAAVVNASASNSNTSGSVTAITAPSVTTNVNDCLILRFGGTREATAVANPASNTDIGTATTGTGGSQSTSRACYATLASAGATGTAAFVSTGNDREWVAATIAIAPSLGPSAAITGTTATPYSTELEILAGGKTILITLSSDTWVAAGGTFDGQRQNIINGLDSAQAEGAGWDAVVKAGLDVTAVVRTSSTLVTITLSAFPTYDITATETITVTVPHTALITSGSDLVATPTFLVVVKTLRFAPYLR